MTVADIIDLILRYAIARNGQSFTRGEFLDWGAHHGLSRRVPSELVDEAFTALLDSGRLAQCDTPPGSVLPAYRMAA